VAGALAVLTPAGPWPVLVAAFALGASTLAPGAILVGWSERATARSLAAGATVGLTLFGALSLVALWGRIGPIHPPAPLLGALLTWPALVALPANLLVAWLGTARVAAAPRSPLAPGLAELHE
jgi:Na+(H+)/acetate symporter ActP